uniref:Uncharacterized protein n=1 Tax=Micrurus corallinus TaxID=54390 RepID=A0A2D4FW55_MICCO
MLQRMYFPQVESAAKGSSATEACKQLTGQSCPFRLGLGGILLLSLEKTPLLPSMLHFPQCPSSYFEGERRLPWAYFKSMELLRGLPDFGSSAYLCASIWEGGHRFLEKGQG